MAQGKVHCYVEVDSLTSYVNCYLKQAACTRDRVRLPFSRFIPNPARQANLTHVLTPKLLFQVQLI